MLKKLFNECKFKLNIITKGPVLIKSGHPTPYGPDMTPVLTYRNNKEQIFIPGSSIKGVLRSHIEKIIRTLNEDVVCMPFAKPENNRFKNSTFCGEKFEHRKKKQDATLKTNEIYKDSCPACRLFGSTFFTGRISPSDAYLVNDEGVSKYTEKRDGVGIDRFTGGASKGAKFELEVVSAGVSFETEIYMRNFEIWQLGAVMLILQDMEDGLIRIGSGRSRGLGAIEGNAKEVSIQYIYTNVVDKNPNEIWGLGKFLNAYKKDYGTSAHNDILEIDDPPEETKRGIRIIQKFNGNVLKNMMEKATNNFVEIIRNWKIPQPMQPDNLNKT